MKIVLFDLNRLSFAGGAEKYLEEVGIKLSKKGHVVSFIGDFRLLLNFYLILGILTGIDSLKKFFTLFKTLNNASPVNFEASQSIKINTISLLTLIPFTAKGKKTREVLKSADMVLAKNEFLDLLLLLFLDNHSKNKYAVIFSSPKYPNPVSFRTVIHNLIYEGKIYKALIKRIDKAIVSNKEDRKYLNEAVGLKKENISYIPYGLNDFYFAKKQDISKKKKFSVTFVGRLEEQKGINELCQIIQKINKKYPLIAKRILFSIAGAGPLESEVKSLVRSFLNVKYLGQLTPEKTRKLYLASDLVIITSKWETFSYVCLEAQACGVPVISFNVSGPNEMIIKKQTGELIYPGNIDSFCLAIIKYFKIKFGNKKKYLLMKNNIIENFKKRYTLENTISAIENIIKNKK